VPIMAHNGLGTFIKPTIIIMSEQTKQIQNPRHVVKAWEKMPLNENRNKFFIEIENGEDVKGVAPIVKFTIQSDPIGEVGVNGCQAIDMLEYTKCLFQSLNDAFPCRENALTITKIEEAIHWQEARTKDRLNRQVEGQNKA
jgi:hypothetical protein